MAMTAIMAGVGGHRRDRIEWCRYKVGVRFRFLVHPVRAIKQSIQSFRTIIESTKQHNIASIQHINSSKPSLPTDLLNLILEE